MIKLQQSFRFGQFTDEHMLEKPESTIWNKESRDIGRIGEIKKERQTNKKKQKTRKNSLCLYTLFSGQNCTFPCNWHNKD
jgi:phosphate-selective porin